MLKVLKAKEKHSDTARYSNKRAVTKAKKKVIYPDSDGKPMAENTLQYEWIVKIKENLEMMFENNSDVFIAGDLLWYPVEGDNKTCVGPDVLVALGRPKGYRGSYRTWEEANISPQVVFEILSPSNSQTEMKNKLKFYERYGVEEYYEYDPDKFKLKGWIRTGNNLLPIVEMQGWISPKMGIRFEIKENDLTIRKPDEEPFLSMLEVNRLRKTAEEDRKKAEEMRKKAEEEKLIAQKQAEEEIRIAQKQAEEEKRRADKEREQVEFLTAKLRELGIEL